MASLGDGDGDGGELLSLHCPICYGEDDSGYATLVCGHIYHVKCLESSLKYKKECPTCRCPAKPIESGRRDGASHPRCPCKTGQPLRLFHLQRPRGGTAAACNATLAEGDSAYRDAAAVAAAMQRETKMREALQEERLRVVELEGEVLQLKEDVARALDKAEQRKQRLVNKEREHVAATAKLVEDKSRLEAQRQEVEQELRRTQQALHVLRIEQEKSKVALLERDNEVMRRKREAALLRARMGGAGAPGLPELVELLGESKEDWQVAYSIKVDELRRAQESAAEVRGELERVTREAAQRLKAEQLAGAEAVKAMTKERDECKRQAIALEYKLISAEQQLRDLAAPASLTPTPTQPAGPTAAGAPHTHAAAPHHRAQPVPHASGSGRSTAAAPPRGFFQPQAPPPPQQQGPLQGQLGAGPSGSGRTAVGAAQRSASAGAAAVRPPAGMRAEEEGGAAVQESQQPEASEDDEWDELAELAMHCTAEDDGMDEGEAEADEAVADDGVGDGGEAQAKRARPAAAQGEVGRAAAGAASDADGTWPPGKRHRPAGPAAGNADVELGELGGSGLLRGPRGGGGGGGSLGADPDPDVGGDLIDAEVQLLLDDDDPVPALPRAYAGLFSNRGAAAGPSGRGAVAAGGGPGGRGIGAAAAGPSFAGKSTSGAYGGTSGAYSRGGSSLIGEGPDGRGGTTRFPLTSSYAQNVAKNVLMKPTSGGRGGRGGGQSRAPVAAAGRIDAFLRPVAKPK